MSAAFNDKHHRHSTASGSARVRTPHSRAQVGFKKKYAARSKALKVYTLLCNRPTQNRRESLDDGRNHAECN